MSNGCFFLGGGPINVLEGKKLIEIASHCALATESFSYYQTDSNLALSLTHPGWYWGRKGLKGWSQPIMWASGEGGETCVPITVSFLRRPYEDTFSEEKFVTLSLRAHPVNNSNSLPIPSIFWKGSPLRLVHLLWESKKRVFEWMNPCWLMINSFPE